MTAGFGQLLHAEWTKFRTVRGWVAGVAVAALLTVSVGLLLASAMHSSCAAPPGQVCGAAGPVGPDGEAVSDQFYFVHQALTGDGGVTARVTSLTGIITYPQWAPTSIVSGLEPWTKAGIIVKDDTRQGSAYAAVLVTGSHGVRMQYDYTHDTAGAPGSVSATSPRWLRLVRAGDTLTGYDSTDGTRWTRVSTATVRLGTTVQVGMFVASPGDVQLGRRVGSGFAVHFTQASAVFDQVSLQSTASGGWRGEAIGESGQTDWERYHRAAGLVRSGGTFTVSGSGDIAPDLSSGRGIERTLIGAIAGLVAVIVVGALFVTAEYRRGLIRTSLAAAPHRGRLLAAKAVVAGSVTLVAALAASAVAVPLVSHVLRANGVRIHPVTALTQLRVITGTALLLAVTAVLAVAIGAMVRRSAVTITVVLGAVIVPYVLAVGSVLPAAGSQWLMRLSPAAAFAVQQTFPQFPQVTGPYTPSNGYFPLAPWAGLAVLCGYAAVALGVAAHLLRRRDS